MKISVVSGILGDYSLDESLAYLSALGVDEFELGVGGYPGKAHADALILSKDKAAREKLLETFKKHNMGISALAVHGNCVHPDKKTAAAFEADFEAACVLAGQIGIDRIVTFSGCPGSDPDAKAPSWITCAWPPDYPKALEWQWNEVLIPYWKKAVKFAADNGVKRIALEMHPGFCVYNPATCLRLRDAVGEVIGANIDPSHLFWQGMDILEVIRELGEKKAIHYFHAKDTQIMESVVRKNGVLDTKSFTEAGERSWIFRTLGYGHGEDLWKQIFSLLKIMGYDDSISIEHEDGLMSPKEGLEKAIKLVKESIIRESNTNMWWA